MLILKKSLLQPNKEEKKCYLCNKPKQHLFKYNIFHENPDLVAKSQRYGCYVNLCIKHFSGSIHGAMYNDDIALKLKADAQSKFMKRYPKKDFVYIFGYDYLSEYKRRNSKE